MVYLWSNQNTILIKLTLYQPGFFFLLGHQPGPKSWHRDLFSFECSNSLRHIFWLALLTQINLFLFNSFFSWVFLPVFLLRIVLSIPRWLVSCPRQVPLSPFLLLLPFSFTFLNLNLSSYLVLSACQPSLSLSYQPITLSSYWVFFLLLHQSGALAGKVKHIQHIFFN